VRFEWGERGLEDISPGSDVIVIVDVLSFCPCVEIATARGATVLPYRWKDETAARYAEEHRAILADGRNMTDGYTLSPTSLVNIPAGTRLVLPSPNGAALSLRAAQIGCVVAASLRNAAAVAGFARARGGPVAVIACGERWADGSLRPAWEDLIGAGAVISGLPSTRSPEAETAFDAFRSTKADLLERMRMCTSGRELVGRGFDADVELVSSVNVSECVPVLHVDAFMTELP